MNMRLPDGSRTVGRILVGLVVWLGMTAAVRADGFEDDLQTLLKTPHRLSGTPEGRQAGDYLEQRLRGMGIEDVYRLDFPMVQTQVSRCEITVGDVTAKLVPIRPNVTIPPVTPGEGLSGPLVYLGRGEAADLEGRAIEGAIAVYEYDCNENWQRAFSLGAKAVVFLGGPDVKSMIPKHAAIPGNLVRLYAPPEVLSRIDLRKDHPKATVVSHVTWERALGTDIVAYLPGTETGRREPEVVVLSTHYDTFGQVPHASPGARGAANCAALLETAEYFAKHRTRRDLLIVFMDNQARYQQGGRAFYQAVLMGSGLDARLRREHLEEKEYVERTLPLLKAENPGQWQADETIRRATIKALVEQCDAMRSDLGRELMRIRMGEDRPDKDDLRKKHNRWNDVRQILSEHPEPAVGVYEQEPELYRALCERVMRVLGMRLDELNVLIRVDEQRQVLRRKLSGRRIILHLGCDLSDVGPTWGLVAGEAIPKGETTSVASADSPGHYPRLLAAFRTAAGELDEDVGLALETVNDPNEGRNFVARAFVAEGKAAGIYGVYNLSVMTGHDGRVRDGHPSDTLNNLDWRHLRKQAQGFRKLLVAADGVASLSQPAVFANRALSKVPVWHNDKLNTTGDFVGLRVTGELLEQRPASGAVLAIWPGLSYNLTQPGYYRVLMTAPFSYDPILVLPVDANGNFELVGVDQSVFSNYFVLAAVFQDTGEVTHISNRDTLQMSASSSARLQTFAASGYAIGPPLMGYGRPGVVRTRVLRAKYDAELRDDESLVGYDGRFTFFYVYRYYNLHTERIKVFHGQGPAFLGMAPGHPYGEGYPLTDFSTPPPVDRWTARDMYLLNEQRLSALRERGVTDRSLEALNGRAGRLLEEVTEDDREKRAAPDEQVELGRSTGLSRRVHGPLRLLMNDLVNAIVILLLLAIPFAFVMERLTICATGIYARLAGFAAIFLVTFGLLFWMHPGFAVASTPLIIFLAFVIILLSSLVIFIVVRKFRTEMKAIQGQSGRRHNIELSWLGTLIAAVNMGISTMRRRPIRTTLSAVTVLILTFTILCFASMSSHVGVRDAYEGSAGEDLAAGIFMRRLDCKEISPDILMLAHGHEGEGGLIAGQWWMVQQTELDTPFSVANPKTGRAFYLDGIMGVSPAEVEHNATLAGVLAGDSVKEKQAALEQNGVYLPQVVLEQLGLKKGDEILLAGVLTRVAGAFDANRLQMLNQLDGRSALPVDFRDPSNQPPVLTQTEIQVEADESMATRDFVRLSPNEVALTSDTQVHGFGGTLHAVNVYPGPQTDAMEQGGALAELVDMPVWVKGPQGVERLIFTRLTEVSGGLALVVPVILGGLIIFGTMLGSVTDRQKEIYSFSALGLAPTDVGFLFFAEAAVYAIVGGMVGQLLAQFVAMGASFLAEHHYIRPVSTNFSSANSLFAMGVVMATVLVSAIYPAYRASRSANPGLQRSWKMPAPEGAMFRMKFPFTVSAYDITGVVGFLGEHFRQHDDAGLGVFAAENVRVGRSAAGTLELSAHLALAPFDLGVTENFTLTASPSEIPGVDEVSIVAERTSGAAADWKRTNRTFLQDLRRQFLLWRTLSTEAVESYRMQTLQEVAGENTPATETPRAVDETA